MSVRVMALIWERDDLDPYERLVLLSLADHADDEGRCYPSIARLCARTSMKERGVQNVLRRLADRGFLTVRNNAGKRGTNLYTVHSTPALNAPRIECTPALNAPNPRTRCTPTPAPGAPEPSFKHQEPSYAAADASDAESVDFAKQLFERGVAYLGRHGVSERQARSLIGKWRKDATDAEVFDAFSASSKAGVTDPVSWITARFAASKPVSVADMIRLASERNHA